MTKALRFRDLRLAQGLFESVAICSLIVVLLALLASVAGCAGADELSRAISRMEKAAVTIDAEIDKRVEKVKAYLDAELERCKALHGDDPEMVRACMRPALTKMMAILQTMKKAEAMQQHLPDLLRFLDILAGELNDVDRRFERSSAEAPKEGVAPSERVPGPQAKARYQTTI